MTFSINIRKERIEMKHTDKILRHVGNMEQMAYVRRMFFGEGHDKNTGVFSFDHGIIYF